MRTWLDKFTAQIIQQQKMREQQTLKEKKDLEERGKQILEMKARIKSEEERLNAEKAAKEAPKQ